MTSQAPASGLLGENLHCDTGAGVAERQIMWQPQAVTGFASGEVETVCTLGVNYQACAITLPSELADGSIA